MSTGKTGRCPVSPICICLVSAEDICLVSTADICPVSTADICPVSTEDICLVSTSDIKTWPRQRPTKPMDEEAWLAEAATAAD